MAASPSSSWPTRTSSPRSAGWSAASTTRARRRAVRCARGRSSSASPPRRAASARAAEKLARKRVDLLVANDVAEEGSGFGTATNRVTLVAADGTEDALPLLPKREVAERILDRVVVGAGRPRRGGADWRGRAPAGDPRPVSATPAGPARITVLDIARMHADGERIAMLTAYDYPTAQLVDEAGIPAILVGDSLGQVLLGYDTTVRVTMEEMLHHTKAVVRGTRRALVVGDMPFLSYATPEDALANAGRFLREAGAQAVKVEGGVRAARIIETLVRAGIPVMGHIGLTPQAINALGKVRVQGKTREQARALLHDALAVQEAGAFAVVARARARAAGGGDHRPPPHPDDRDRGRRRLRRPDPGDHRRPRPGLVRAAPRPPVRRPARNDPRGRERLPRRRRGRHLPRRRAVEPDGRGGPRRGPWPGDRRPGRDGGRDRSGGSRSTATCDRGAGGDAAAGRTPGPAGRPPLVVRSRAELADALAPGARGRSAWSPRWAGSTPATARSSPGPAPRCATVAVSIFVNPRQFGNPADLERYPRSEARDLAICAEEGVDLVWAPAVDDVYPARASTRPCASARSPGRSRAPRARATSTAWRRSSRSSSGWSGPTGPTSG